MYTCSHSQQEVGGGHVVMGEKSCQEPRFVNVAAVEQRYREVIKIDNKQVTTVHNTGVPEATQQLFSTFYFIYFFFYGNELKREKKAGFTAGWQFLCLVHDTNTNKLKKKKK